MDFTPNRPHTEKLLELLDEGILDPKEVLVSLIAWLKDEEIEEFVHANEYYIDDEYYEEESED